MQVIKIFDTTLRDGEQTCGIFLTKEEKLHIAEGLCELGVDVIEAGFPAASAGEFEAVREIARNIKDVCICALARAKKEDIDCAAEAISCAKDQPRIHTFIATSPIHREYKLKLTKEEIIDITTAAVKYAKSKVADVEFSPEDATRTEIDFLCQVITAAIRAGATVINIPDTVGYALPDEFANLIKTIKERVPQIDKVTLSAHCHDDLGLAVANSIAAILNGAQQIECTINGLGERAGNAALEEIVMVIYTKKASLDVTTKINTTHLYRLSQLVSSYTGIEVQPNKAIVGKNAFVHTAGIHQAGVLQSPLTYEIITPQTVGVPQSSLPLSKLSGKHALAEHYRRLGYKLTEDELNKAFSIFKDLADKKPQISDEDLTAIINDEVRSAHKLYELAGLQVWCGKNTIPTATVQLKTLKGEILSEAACGNGPVDAVYKAIDKLINKSVHLLNYSLKALSESKDALGEVRVQVRLENSKAAGRGISTDIIEASAKAYIDAINKLLQQK